MTRLEDFRPADTPAHMTDAWLERLECAVNDVDIVEAFLRDTGRTGISALHERAYEDMTQGRKEVSGVSLEFIQWFNVNIWGPLDGGKAL